MAVNSFLEMFWCYNACIPSPLGFSVGNVLEMVHRGWYNIEDWGEGHKNFKIRFTATIFWLGLSVKNTHFENFMDFFYVTMWLYILFYTTVWSFLKHFMLISFICGVFKIEKILKICFSEPFRRIMMIITRNMTFCKQRLFFEIKYCIDTKLSDIIRNVQNVGLLWKKKCKKLIYKQYIYIYCLFFLSVKQWEWVLRKEKKRSVWENQ